MGTMRRGNGNVTGGVPFVATTLTRNGAQSLDPEMEQLITHALTAEGTDASENGTGQETPVPVDFVQITSKANRSNPRAGDPAPTMAAASQMAVAFNETHGGNSIHEGVAPTIGTAGTGGSATSVVASAVRRLTPVECERLQGFPDNWTAVSAGKPQSDSARYRQLGNSIAEPVFEWVARRIMVVENASMVIPPDEAAWR